MSRTSIFSRFRSGNLGKRIGKRPARLHFERLERRAMLATFFVEVGGTGDGSPSDPFGTIQAAVDAAAASPGPDQVMIGPGTYMENIEIADDDPVTLQGKGDVTIQAADPSEDVINGEGDLTLRNLAVTGGDDGVDAEGDSVSLFDVIVTGNDDEGLTAEEIDRVMVVRSHFSGNGDDGIKVEDANDVSIMQSTSSENGGDGIDLEIIGTIRITNTSASTNGDEGLEVDDAGSIHVTGGDFSGNADEGVDIDNSSEITVVGITANGNGGAGFQSEAGDDDDPDIDTISSISLTNSSFENNGGDGVEITEDDDGVINEARLVNVTARDNGARGFDLDVSGRLILARLISEGNAQPDDLS